jgi:hypothetical protein
MGWCMFTASGIKSVTLINKKDRPLVIFEIHAEMDGLSFGLHKFEPPLILKAMEATIVEIDPVSYRYLGDQKYEWKHPDYPGSINIYLSLPDRILKCQPHSPPDRLVFGIKRNLRPVTNAISRFNGRIYNDRVKFAIIYKDHERGHQTAFIHQSGFIDWPLMPNMLASADVKDEASVRVAVMATGLEPLISPFEIVDPRK